MKKVLFTTMSIIAVAAMMLVSCKKDNGTDDNKKEEKPAVEEYAGPVEGTSAWSVVGTLLESNWGSGAHGDYVMAEASEGIFVLKNVKLAATDEFKFRENKGWDNAYKGVFATLGEAFDVDNAPGGNNIKPELDGIYDLYLNVTVEQAAIVAKDGAQPAWKEVVVGGERTNVFHITPELSENWLLEKPIEGLASGFTVEVRFYATAWNDPGMPNRLIALEGKGEHPAVMLRFSNGDKSQSGQLHLSCDDFFGGAQYSPQVTSKPGEGEEQGAAYIFEANKWHSLAVTYDGSEMSVYDNGELVNTYATKLAYQAFTIERIEFGMSWEYSFNNDEYSLWQLFKGFYDYIRVWNKPLAASEIAAGLCDVASNAEGLCGYWVFDDVEANSAILPDRVGKNSIDWTKMSEMDGSAVRKTLDLGESFKNAIEEFDGTVCE